MSGAAPGLTPWHTIGPFFPGGFFREGDNDLTRAIPDAPAANGQPIVVRGHVRQEGGLPAVNAVVDAWQADAHGLFRHPDDPGWRQADPHFFGWGRSWTDAQGRFSFRSVMPGGYDDVAGRRAPHVNLAVTASGIMRRLVTTMFFPGFADNDGDPVLRCVPDGRRALLIAEAAGTADDGALLFAFDILLRGAAETPFFRGLRIGMVGTDLSAHFTVTRDVGIAVECHVEGEGRPVVLLPSLGRGVEDYATLARLLAQAGYRVLRPQPRGVGASKGPMEAISLHELAADVAAVLDHEGGRRAVVAGHAFGSRVARVLAHDRPDLVRGVVLLAAAGRRPIAPDLRVAIDGSGDPSLSRAARLAHLRAAFFAPGHDPAEWLEGWHPAVSAMQKEATLLTSQDVFITAGTAPILEVQAALDTVVPRLCANDLKDELGDRVTVVVVPDAGHALIPEQPQAVAAAMLAWMAGLDGRHGDGGPA